MCFDHDEYADFCGTTYPRCRKSHRCEECHQRIEVGDLARNDSGLFDGAMFSVYFCGACDLTRHQIHLHELAEGCKGYETWCPNGALLDYCEQAEFPRAEALAGQEWLATKREEQREANKRKAVAK